MENALVIGSSGGIGAAVAAALQTRGTAVTGVSRRVNGLDITNDASVASVLSTVDAPFDLVVVATGALEINDAKPEKTIKAISGQAMLDQFALNTVGPALVLGHAARLLPRDRRSVFAVLSARVGSIGDNRLGGWVSYRSAKAAVNQVVRCAAIELARSHSKAAVVSLHPGTVATRFTEKYVGRHPAVPPAEAAQNLLAVMDGLTPDQTGQFFDWSGAEIPW
ncbi:MAG: SDR family NAD(P)-dependent oxidoreductase [Pseudomonadota bacterium]